MSESEIVVDYRECIGCGLCVDECPFAAIESGDWAPGEIDDETAEKTQGVKISILEQCTLCNACVEVCPTGAIVLKADTSVHTDNLEQYKGVWIFAEQKRGQLAGVTFELLGEGRKLADAINEDLSAVLLGSNMGDAAAELLHYGADQVYYMDSPELDYYDVDLYSECVARLIRQFKPNMMLTGATVELDAFLLCVVDFLDSGGHFLFRPAIDQIDFFGAKAQ